MPVWPGLSHFPLLSVPAHLWCQTTSRKKKWHWVSQCSSLRYSMSCFIIIYTVAIIAILVTTILLLFLLVIFRHDLRGISEKQHKSSARSRRMGQLIKCQSDGQSWDKPGTISESWTTSDKHREMDGSGTRPRPSPSRHRTLLPTHIFKHNIAPSLSLLHLLMQVRKFAEESCFPSHITDHSLV